MFSGFVCISWDSILISQLQLQFVSYIFLSILFDKILIVKRELIDTGDEDSEFHGERERGSETMAAHGKLGEYKPGKEDWKSYTERLSQYYKMRILLHHKI